MIIRRSKINRLDELFKVLLDCKTAMENDNIFQWTDTYPNRDILFGDLRNGHVYEICDQERILGTITLNSIEDAQYSQINWMDKNGKVLVIHRLAILSKYQNKGLGKRLMRFAEKYAAKHGFTSIRFDAYSGNLKTIGFYQRLGYIKRGEVIFPGRILPFSCYETIIGTQLAAPR